METLRNNFSVNAVDRLDPERAKAILKGVVDLCMTSGRYDLTTHSVAWNYLAEEGALETRSLE